MLLGKRTIGERNVVLHGKNQCSLARAHPVSVYHKHSLWSKCLGGKIILASCAYSYCYIL